MTPTELIVRVVGAGLTGSLGLYFTYRAIARNVSRQARRRDLPLDREARRSARMVSVTLVFFWAAVLSLGLCALFIFMDAHGPW